MKLRFKCFKVLKTIYRNIYEKKFRIIFKIQNLSQN